MNNRTAIFIDGANLYATAKALQLDLDYKRLLNYYGDDLIRAYYYTAIIDSEDFSTIRPLIDWLDYNGFKVVTKPTKEFVDAQGRRKVKGNMDIELAIDAIELAVYGHMDKAVIFTGDGDFKHLVVAMQRHGVHVTIVSSIITQPPMCADELRRAADAFVDLNDIAGKIVRAEARPARSRFSHSV